MTILSELLENAAHIIPKGDRFCHTEASWCACNPRLDARAVSGIGAGAWYTHRLQDPDSNFQPRNLKLGVPITTQLGMESFPEEWV